LDPIAPLAFYLVPEKPDKPAWLDHIGRPQQTMKIRHFGMVSLLLRGDFRINGSGCAHNFCGLPGSVEIFEMEKE
jgi:hypothetical protein